MPVTAVRTGWSSGKFQFKDTSETAFVELDGANKAIDVLSGGTLKIAGTALTGTAAELNKLAGVTAGTVTASKAVVVDSNKAIDTLVIADGGLKLGSGAGTAVDATAAELNRAADVSARSVLAGSTLAVTEALHDGKTIKFDQLAGSVCTLPAASGSGARFRFATFVLATSNSHIVKVANATDIFVGAITVIDAADDSNTTFATAGTSDTITLNRTTTGSVRIGELIEVEDIKTGFWAVRGVLVGTGGEATPFSATV